MSLILLALLAVEIWIPAKLPPGSRVAATLDGKAVDAAVANARPRLIVVADFQGSAGGPLMAALRAAWPAIAAEEPVELRVIDAAPLEIVAAGDVPSVFARPGAVFDQAPREPRPMRESNALEWIAGRNPWSGGPARMIWISETFDWSDQLRTPPLDRFFSADDAKPPKLTEMAPPMPQLAASGLAVYPVWVRRDGNNSARERARTLADYGGGRLFETTPETMEQGILAAVRGSRDGTSIAFESLPPGELGDRTPHQLRVAVPGASEFRRLLLDQRQAFSLAAPPNGSDWAPKLYTRSSELGVSGGCGGRPGRLRLTPSGDLAPRRARIYLREMPPRLALIRRATIDADFSGGSACIDLPVIRPGDRWRIVAIGEEDNWLGYSAFTVTERK